MCVKSANPTANYALRLNGPSVAVHSRIAAERALTLSPHFKANLFNPSKWCWASPWNVPACKKCLSVGGSFGCRWRRTPGAVGQARAPSCSWPYESGRRCGLWRPDCGPGLPWSAPVKMVNWIDFARNPTLVHKVIIYRIGYVALLNKNIYFVFGMGYLSHCCPFSKRQLQNALLHFDADFWLNFNDIYYILSLYPLRWSIRTPNVKLYWVVTKICCKKCELRDRPQFPFPSSSRCRADLCRVVDHRYVLSGLRPPGWPKNSWSV